MRMALRSLMTRETLFHHHWKTSADQLPPDKNVTLTEWSQSSSFDVDAFVTEVSSHDITGHVLRRLSSQSLPLI